MWINKFRLKGNCINKLNAFVPTKKLSIKIRKHQYYLTHKEKILDKTKKWQNNNPEKVKEYTEKYKENMAEKVKCNICGSIVGKYKLQRHQKTKKCQNNNNK